MLSDTTILLTDLLNTIQKLEEVSKIGKHWQDINIAEIFVL